MHEILITMLHNPFVMVEQLGTNEIMLAKYKS
jgi:hypothetical protein